MKTIKRVMMVLLGGATVALVLSAGSCDAPQNAAQTAANDKAANGYTYIPKNDIERKNYNTRTELADNPASLIWCSVYPTNPNVKPFTVPIMGKLTSGNKRPIPTEYVDVGNDNDYYPEKPGPDGMYGTSADYRYGFDPAGNYWDFYNVETTCSSAPNIIQKATTQIGITATGDLNALDTAAEKALAECRKHDNNDSSKACPEAARILGI